jgi:hypothetical protein
MLLAHLKSIAKGQVFPMFKKLLPATAAIALAGAVALAVPARALEFAAHPVGEHTVAVSVWGIVKVGDSRRFAEFFAHLDSGVRYISLVAFNSHGGDLEEALAIATMIHHEGFRTGITNGAVCSSACFWMFMAGNHRTMGQNGRLGVHSVSVNGRETDSTLASTADLVRYGHALGIPDTVLIKLLVTQQDHMAWLPEADLRALDVTIVVPRRGDTRGGRPGSLTGDSLLPWFATAGVARSPPPISNE